MTNYYSPAAAEKSNRVEYLKIPSQLQKGDLATPTPFYLPVIRFLMSIVGRFFPGFTAKIAFKLFTTPQIRAKHKISDKILSAAKISEILVGANILKIYEWGAGDKNILLVHGWESRGTAMRSFVEPLVEKGYRVIAFDGPAHGNSTGKRTNLIEFSEATSAILKRLGKVEGIITHSFGAHGVVFSSRKIIPDFPIKKLVMVAVPMGFTDILKKVKTTMNFPNTVEKGIHRIVEKIAEEPVDNLTIPAGAGKTNIEDVLIIHDKKDGIVDFKFAEDIHNTWSNSRMIVTEGLGHYRIMKHEKIKEKVVDFLTE